MTPRDICVLDFRDLQFSRSVVSDSLRPHESQPEFTQTHVHRVSDAIQPSLGKGHLPQEAAPCGKPRGWQLDLRMPGEAVSLLGLAVAGHWEAFGRRNGDYWTAQEVALKHP